MAYIKAKGSEELIKADVLPVSANRVHITTDTEPILTGFNLYLDKEGKYPMDKGEYEAYTTLYKQGDDWYELSNDGSVYVEPEPIPEPTEEELAERERQRQIANVRAQISNLKTQITETDYQIIKTYEYSLVGLESEYDIGTLHVERQNLRDQINELEKQLSELLATE